MPKMGARGLKYGGQSGIRFRLAEIGSSRAMALKSKLLLGGFKMFSMNLFTISIAIIFVFAQAKDHPTLPTQWTAITIEPGAGEGQESYNFVAEPPD